MARYEARVIMTIVTDEISEPGYMQDEIRSELLNMTGGWLEPRTDENGDEMDIELDVHYRVSDVKSCEIRRQTDE